VQAVRFKASLRTNHHTKGKRMKRRSFLKGLVGGAVAAPVAAKQAMDAAVADLSLSNGVGLTNAANLGSASNGRIEGGSNAGWAFDGLKKLAGRTVADHVKAKRGQYISALDPNVASLRSVALHKKIAMTRDIVYEASLRNEKDYLQSVIDGISF
jgi:hypothetical protein